MQQKLKNIGDFSYWQRRIYNEVLTKPGEHILIQGHTGAGKTNLMKWLMSGFLTARSKLSSEQWETIVWFDRGKSSEILQLAKLAPLRLLLPEGCSMEINITNEEEKEQLYEIKQVHFSNPSQIWRSLDRDSINIICIQRFLIDPSKFSATVAKMFKALILDSFDYKIHPLNTSSKILLPRITIFIDEINNIAPSKGQGTGSREESNAGAWIQQNIEQIRSQNIRLIGSVHGWRKVRPGVRSSFQNHVALPGAYYPASEKPKLSRFNPMFEKLAVHSACFVFERDIFSNPILIPWMGKGEDLGYILYRGHLGPVKQNKPETPAVDTVAKNYTDLKQLLIQALQAGGQTEPCSPTDQL